jgi:hypothetical protein
VINGTGARVLKDHISYHNIYHSGSKYFWREHIGRILDSSTALDFVPHNSDFSYCTYRTCSHHNSQRYDHGSRHRCKTLQLKVEPIQQSPRWRSSPQFSQNFRCYHAPKPNVEPENQPGSKKTAVLPVENLVEAITSEETPASDETSKVVKDEAVVKGSDEVSAPRSSRSKENGFQGDDERCSSWKLSTPAPMRGILSAHNYCRLINRNFFFVNGRVILTIFVSFNILCRKYSTSLFQSNPSSSTIL